jgi:tetratricopeptide (TPR) repeat protein
MPSHQSLAELTLRWCAGEVAAGRELNISQKEREALTRTSREAAKASGVALLQAAAAELNTADNITLGVVAAVIEDDDAMADLEDKLATHSQPASSPRERAEMVGHHFKEWMMQQVGSEIPDKMQGWLQRGWPDLRARGGVMTFYQAFCSALQRTVRQDQSSWNEHLKNTGVQAVTWRQWLIREADAGVQAASRASGKKAVKVLAVLAMIAAIAGGAAWYWWSEIEGRVRALKAQEEAATVNPEATGPSPEQADDISSVRPPTPEPKTTQQPTPPKVDTAPAFRATPLPLPPEPGSPATPGASAESVPARTSEQLPRVNVRPDPLAEAARLMTEAESTLASEDHSAGDRSARSAQDILSVRLPSNDPQLAEALIRVAQYWERRDDWAEAARLYQFAVKAYEKTPAENTNPQLQAVSRWASALRHSGRNTEAERLYRMLLQAYEGMGTELRPEMASVAHNLGNVLFATGRLRDARESYALALKLMVDQQSVPSAEPALTRFKESYAECLKKLGVSEPQIEADIRRTLGLKPAVKSPGKR